MKIFNDGTIEKVLRTKRRVARTVLGEFSKRGLLKQEMKIMNNTQKNT